MKRLISKFIVIILILPMLPVSLAAHATASATTAADDLYQLGLFSGTGTREDGTPIYDLDRVPTRHEAITMLVALLGKSDDAQNGTWTTPFTDVVPWAQPFVGYAYANHLTLGTSSTTFGGNLPVTAAQYLTFVLTAMGYQSGADFQWDKAWVLSDQLGITQGQYHDESDSFSRGDLAKVSRAALNTKLKDTDQTLAEKLIDEGLFTKAEFETVSQQRPVAGNQDSPLTALEISQKCSPAVFYIEVYGLNGALSSSGSGFFISPDGLAVTNFHVAANSSALKIQTIDGKTYSHVTIIASDEENDLALLQVNGSNFPYLEIGDSASLQQGQQVYAFGSPIGLSNTMSEGIISNPKRIVENGQQYIQISVPIAPGSSGGALVNERGKVIGVTSAGYTSLGADLNLAVPIEKINALNMQSTDDLILWSPVYYPSFYHALDFGEFSGVQLLQYVQTPLGYIMQYDLFDFHDIDDVSASDLFAYTMYWYRYALLDNGFTQTNNFDTFTGVFETDTELLTSFVDFDEDPGIYISVERKPFYYETTPALPDLGWYLGIGDVQFNTIENSIIYSYQWSKYYYYSDLVSYLNLYFQLLEESGFTFIGSEGNNWLFDGHGLSVVFILDESRLFVDIAEIA
ncbi:MAG: S1C family serine protease [Lawsonibacter sp.]|jgi:hypothetical protein